MRMPWLAVACSLALAGEPVFPAIVVPATTTAPAMEESFDPDSFREGLRNWLTAGNSTVAQDDPQFDLMSVLLSRMVRVWPDGQVALPPDASALLDRGGRIGAYRGFAGLLARRQLPPAFVAVAARHYAWILANRGDGEMPTKGVFRMSPCDSAWITSLPSGGSAVTIASQAELTAAIIKLVPAAKHWHPWGWQAVMGRLMPINPALRSAGCAVLPSQSPAEANAWDVPIDGQRILRQRYVLRFGGAILLPSAAELASLGSGARIDARGLPVRDVAVFSGLALTALDLGWTDVTDLRPLASQTQLSDLSLNGLPLTDRDLAPLAGLPLARLDLTATRITAIPKPGATLRRLSVADTGVHDLAPLAGSGVTHLDLRKTPVADLAPLAGLRLRRLDLAWTKVTSLAPLQGHPLDYLDLDFTSVSDAKPLAECTQLGEIRWNPKVQLANDRILCAIKTLRRIAYEPAKDWVLKYDARNAQMRSADDVLDGYRGAPADVQIGE